MPAPLPARLSQVFFFLFFLLPLLTTALPSTNGSKTLIHPDGANMLEIPSFPSLQCIKHFGLEIEFAYIGEAVDNFFEDDMLDAEPELLMVLSLLARSVTRFNKWPTFPGESTTYTKSKTGTDFAKLSLEWTDAIGRKWKVAQESVGGRLFDGLEVITPKLNRTDEAAWIVRDLFQSHFLAKAPHSGMHIWVDSSCLVGQKNAKGMARLMTDYEDLWAHRVKKRFAVPSTDLRKRFWKTYKSCNPKLLKSVHKMLVADFRRHPSTITFDALRSTFLNHTSEELKCLRVRTAPDLNTRAGRKLWRYKELNLASALNITVPMRSAVEFRAWDFMSGEKLEHAIEIAFAIVHAAAFPAMKPRLLKMFATPKQLTQKDTWSEISLDEMHFQRKLQQNIIGFPVGPDMKDLKDPKDPKFPEPPPGGVLNITAAPTTPTTSAPTTMQCEDIDQLPKSEREAMCTESIGCGLDKQRSRSVCFRVDTCEDYNQFTNTNNGRKKHCTESSIMTCIFIGSSKTCRVPFPTQSPTTPQPTASPVVSSCEDNNDRSFAPKSIREAGCTEEKGCEWSSATSNGECYEVNSCDDFNQFKTTSNGRKKLCLDSIRFNCIYVGSSNTCRVPFPTTSPTTPEPTASPVVSTCEQNNDKNFAPRSTREAGCTHEKGCIWNSAIGNGECYEVNSCDDFNLFKNTNSGRKKLCLASEDFPCIFVGTTCRVPFPTASPTTPEPTASPTFSSCETNNDKRFGPFSLREAGCTSEKGCVWSAKNGGECHEITHCDDFNNFKLNQNSRKSVCLTSQEFTCIFEQNKCRVPHPTQSPTTPEPTQSPVVSTCEDNNDPRFASKTVRKSGCTTEKNCAWSDFNGGECYEIAGCDDFNQFNSRGKARERECLETTDFTCIFENNLCRVPHPTASPTTPQPTQSPVPSTCEDNNDKRFASRSVRERGCTREKGCLWSGRNGGECHEVAVCDDVNEFKLGQNSRKIACLDILDLTCIFENGQCSVPHPTGSPTTPAPTASPVASTCADNNDKNYASKDVREEGCTPEKGCVWSTKNGGECHAVASCNDFNNFRLGGNSRKSLCLNGEFNCIFERGFCSDPHPTTSPTTPMPTMSPAPVSCAEIHSKSFGSRSQRQAACEDKQEDGCVWSTKNGGECYLVTQCSEFNQFRNSGGSRRSVCTKSEDPVCIYAGGSCRVPFPTTSPTTRQPTASPVETTCEQNNDKKFASKSVREEGCTEAKGCVWSPKAGGQCQAVSTCDDFNKFKTKANGRKNACLESSIPSCIFNNNKKLCSDAL